MAHLPRLVLERLMLYHRFLSDPKRRKNLDSVTSAEIAKAFDIDPTQVRKDLGSIGLRGRGRVGFPADDALAKVSHVLGFEQTNPAIVVGVGHLGGALIAYEGFARYGLRIVAAFDNDPAKVGHEIADCPVRHTRTMRAFVTRHQIRLAIVATPAGVAQKVADDLVTAGISAIWNFAPVRLSAPPNVCLRNEHISLGLAQIAHYLAG